MRAAPLFVGLALVAMSGCATKIDRMLLRGPIDQAMLSDDMNMICTSALANIPMGEGFLKNKPPRRSLAILEVTASACDEAIAWEAELAAERATRNLEGEVMLSTVKDHRAQERRIRTRAAARMWRAFSHAEASYGPIGEGCPKLRKSEDEQTYVLGLFAGANALLQDKTGGGRVGVPADTIAKVGRGAECVDDDTWWNAPSAIRAGWWVMVPGVAPEGVDAWQALDDAAAKGDKSGVRVARAVQAQLAANAGRDDIVQHAVEALVKAREEYPTNPDYRLLDVYAALIVQHQSDLIWTRAEGHRTPELGQFPSTGADVPDVNPFGEDPFGEGDPFAEEPTPTPPEETKDPK